MQKKVNTTNIETLDCKVTIDVFNRKFKFDFSDTIFTNSPIGNGVQFAISVEDSGGLKLAEIDFDNPQIPNAYEDLIYELELSSILDWQFLFQKYKIRVAAKDDADVVYLDFPIKEICQPKDFTDAGYSLGAYDVIFNCTNNYLTIKETTNVSYKEKEPYKTEIDGKLYYPQGTKTTLNFNFTPFSDTNIYTGIYRLEAMTTCYYDFNDGFFIKLTYYSTFTEDVTCQQAMQELLCCVTDYQIEKNKHCGDAIGKSMEERWNNASIPFFTGILKEMSGQDASKEAKEVKDILRCSCTSKKIKKVQQSVTPNSNILVDGSGATTVVQTIIGVTKKFTINSKSYTIVKNDAADIAFTIHPVDTSVPNVVKTPISFNYEKLAENIYNATENSEQLLIQLNSLIQASGLDLSSLNGKCVIDISANNYFLSKKFASAETAIAKILVNGTEYIASPSIAINNANAIEVWLNSLDIGTFEVNTNVVSDGIYINILSSNNSEDIKSIVFINKGAFVTVPFQKTNKSLIAVIQAIIDYICNISTEKIILGRALNQYSINNSNQVITTSYPSNTILADFLGVQSGILLDFATRIKNFSQITCDKIKDIFPKTLKIMGNNDYIFGVKEGECARILPVELGTRVLQLGISDPIFMAAFCSAVEYCRSGSSCTPYSVFQVDLDDVYSTLFDIIVSFQNSDAISHDISYARIDLGTPTYNTYSGITTSPYTIPVSVPKGQYRIGIKPNYANGRVCPIEYYDTPTCGTITSFLAALNYDSGHWYIDVTCTSTTSKIKIVIVYPNGGISTQIYNVGGTIHIPIPDNQNGDFHIYAQAVCNEDTGWVSPPTPPIILNKDEGGGIVIENQTESTNITDITGITFTSIVVSPLVIGAGAIVSGSHSSSYGKICVAVDLEVGSQSFDLYINGILQENVVATTIGVHCTAKSYIISDTDIIRIVLKQP